ncbi:hypothetical protein RHSIM_Rhsim01G0058200 [Rhododendron simsii]|uniref:Uncharacterized protein n=1 Tax=Rhododendron simsii TaxID=118357 RepID=A0A834HFQ5_RHOSS|nr:hypothetical protein RHSIM_Rhsim01G0058200 [Rhododendron simsii]
MVTSRSASAAMCNSDRLPVWDIDELWPDFTLQKVRLDRRRQILHLGVHGGATEEVGCVMAEIDKDGNSFIDLRKFTEFHGNGMSLSPDAANKEFTTRSTCITRAVMC